MKKLIYFSFSVIVAIALFIFASLPSFAAEYINPPTLFPSQQYGYSQGVAIEGGKIVYLSGQVALDKNHEIVGKGDLAAQTNKALENIKLALESIGATPDDLVEVDYFVPNYKPEDVYTIVDALKSFFAEGKLPAGTLIGVQSLASPDYLIEIKAIAVIDSNT